MRNLKEKSLVVLSGGQDSTTCLFWAKKNFLEVETVTFDYGQRHKIELEAAKKISEIAKVKNRVISINTFGELGGNALTGEEEVEANSEDGELPNTFVPGRNLVFLTFAAAYAHQRGIQHIVTGVCQTDYSGYPDCRQNTIDALQVAINLGMESQVKIHTPLMWMTKAETVHLAEEVEALDAMAWSHTCYNGAIPPCEKCPACELRKKGFDDAGIKDPLIVRTNDSTQVS